MRQRIEHAQDAAAGAGVAQVDVLDHAADRLCSLPSSSWSTSRSSVRS